jgi:hypothetical protein
MSEHDTHPYELRVSDPLTPKASVLVLSGRTFESADSVKERLGVGEMQLQAWRNKGLPTPLKLSRRRYYDREQLEQFLVSLM